MSGAEYYTPRADWSLIPDHMKGGVVRYVMNGIPPGSFLSALLANDFMEARGRADDVNADNMRGWAMFLYNHVPADCHGSYELVKAWVESGGLLGQREAVNADPA